MNTQQAKKLSLPDILARLGHQPIKSAKGGNELWYLSPFRVEKDGSFHTSFLGGQWIWKDFGDTGGNIIDFAMRFKNTDLKGALAFLDKTASTTPKFIKPFVAEHQYLFEESAKTEAIKPPYKVEATAAPEEKKLIFDKERTLQITVGYIKSRGIELGIAKKYLTEVFFHNAETHKQYYAIGIKNRAGGYEIRNPYFKSSLGGKDITCIKGRIGQSVAVFEGFMDFLSYLTDIKFEDLEKDTIILNTASFEKTAIELIKEKGYKKAHLFFDNDKTGHMLTENFIESLDGVEVVPENHRYHPHKDYNEMLLAQLKSVNK